VTGDLYELRLQRGRHLHGRPLAVACAFRKLAFGFLLPSYDDDLVASVGGIPEVVLDGQTGLLVDLGEGFEPSLSRVVVSLLEDPARAAALGRAGRERAVSSFGWDAVGALTLEDYRSVLGSPR